MLDGARLAALRTRLVELRGRSAALTRQLGSVDPADLSTREDFERLPVLRKSDLAAMQAVNPPFGGFAASPTGAFTRLFASPGGIYEAESGGRDPWGAAKAFVAAGVVPGEIVVNCFPYHLTPGGRIAESGALTIGCLVIPAGPGNTEDLLSAVVHFKPSVYCGTPDLLKILLDKGRVLDADVSSIRKAVVSGAALPASLRTELEAAGLRVRQIYAAADLGVIAYESDGPDGKLLPGMLVNEDTLVEILTPGTNRPVAEGEVGEIVVTRLREDYPLLRFATGDLSSWSAHDRISGWMGRADQSAKVRGVFVHPHQIAEVGRRHPELGVLRLVVRRDGEQDAMTLLAESASAVDGLAEAVATTIRTLTKLRGEVLFVAPGSLPNDGMTVADERSSHEGLPVKDCP